MTIAVATLTCAGCGSPQPDLDVHPYPFRCVRADELPDVDHVVVRRIERHPPEILSGSNPFIRYRRLLYSYGVARERGLSDAQFVDIVSTLDESIAAVDGRGFAVTPLGRNRQLEDAAGIEPPGALWIKDETHNVAGSHKARHLMGVMLYLRVVETLRLDEPKRRGLAIASCGNAALAAAVVARAAGYPLRVFVPANANESVVERIRTLGASVEVCPRAADRRGDPSYARFRQAVAEGALPFCCQGNENGLTIEGGETLGLELAEAALSNPIDRLFIQVGGGALASACLRAFDDMHARTPRFHAVQTRGAFPLKRAYDAVAARLAANDQSPGEAMEFARAHRGAFMRPWGTEPRSVAHGILDDETYDWAAVVEGMLRSGGRPVVVGEDELERANALARSTTRVDVDHTGSAGLAGAMQLIGPARRESIAVVFSGITRPG